MQSIKDLLPTTRIPMQTELGNVLTPEERQAAIDWAILQEKKHYARNCGGKWQTEAELLERIAKQDWLKKIDVDKVVEDANVRKIRAMEEQAAISERAERKRKEMEELKAKHTANFFYNTIRAYFIENHGRFIYDVNNEKYIKTVCFFFSNDQRFQTELGYDFNKGLLIVGSAGLGKTKTIQAISRNLLNPVYIYSMIDIAEEVRETGGIDILMNKTILLDDVGSEQEVVNHYGTKINWFKETIESYYLHHNQEFNKLIVTTNCGADAIEHKYGLRVRSRMHEIFNVVEIKGNDLRK